MIVATLILLYYLIHLILTHQRLLFWGTGGSIEVPVWAIPFIFLASGLIDVTVIRALLPSFIRMQSGS